MKNYKAIINGINCYLIEFSITTQRLSSGFLETMAYIVTEKDLQLNFVNGSKIKISIEIDIAHDFVGTAMLLDSRYSNNLFYYNLTFISCEYKDNTEYKKLISEINKYNINKVLNS